jgi:uncharacterized oligopeptide transporter (OPT) family protein
MTAVEPSNPAAAPPKRLLPRLIPLGSARYYVFLALIAIFILGPLGGVTAAYMNFSLGFFVGGQVLAGILGSTVTYFYGPEGKHGANYMQTAAASVASMSAMGVLIQAMVWLGLPEPPVWHLILYFLCIGMFGVGVGLLYTPVLVDRLQLMYPSGLAVANILRALTDVRLLKRSVRQLFTGIGVGAAFPLALEKFGKVAFVAKIAETGVSTSTLGAGMIVGARISVPAITWAILWQLLTPWLRAKGWLDADAPYRKFAFLVALGTIMGAAVVDIALILYQAAVRVRSGAPKAEVPAGEEWKRTNTTRLILWLVAWGVGVIFVATYLMQVPLLWVLLAVAFAFVMMLVNGISLGITDSNPISSAFVLTIVTMAGLGLVNPIVGLLAASIVFVVCSIGGDMQQDRSTGWRLGTNRTHQFRYQVIGVLLGAVLAVYMSKVFMTAYPVLKINTYLHPDQKVEQWQSAMTYKFVGALSALTKPRPEQIPAMLVGVGIGLVTEIARKIIKANASYREWAKKGTGLVFDFLFDAVLLPSPYASSFAGFVEFGTSMWLGVGGIVSSIWNTITERLEKQKKEAKEKEREKGKAPISPFQAPGEDADAAPKEEDLPEDMSTTSLLGGGLIAGDSIAALVLGVIGLLSLVK